MVRISYVLLTAGLWMRHALIQKVLVLVPDKICKNMCVLQELIYVNFKWGNLVLR